MLVDSMSPELACRLASVVQPGRRAGRGDPLPPLWQWAYFAAAVTNEQIGEDGHPKRDDPWAESFPRRVAGAGRVERLAPLVLGRPATKRSVLERAEEKSGRSGRLVVCDWRHTYLQDEVTVIDEVQTLVYRPRVPAQDWPSRAQQASPVISSPPGHREDEGPSNGGRGSWSVVRRLEFSPTLLFRFSASTWNSHRIHYDRGYASSEGYPGLLVHGPLLAMLMAQEAEQAIGDLRLLEFRALSPVFDNEVVDLYLDLTESGCRLEARKPDGTLASFLTASAGAP